MLVFTFIDDYTRITKVCLMTKDEVNFLLQKFHKMIESQYKTQVQVRCSDNKEEYHSFVRQE
jgi:hypothetical protein